MTDLLIAAQAAPITIELPTAVSAAAWVITVLLAGIGEPEHGMTTAECAAVADRLRNAFESGLSDHAPALRRPVCWPELLFVPAGSRSPGARVIRDGDGSG